jgi:hypothetical protein
MIPPPEFKSAPIRDENVDGRQLFRGQIGARRSVAPLSRPLIHGVE